MLKKSSLLALVRYQKLPYYEVLTGRATNVTQESKTAVHKFVSKKAINQNVSSNIFWEQLLLVQIVVANLI